MDGDKTLIDPLKAANLLGHEGFDPDDVQHHLDHYILERGEAVIAFSDDPDGFDREPRHRLCTNLDTTCARVMFVFTKSDTGRVNLLCIDELGYIELDRRGAELLFQVLTEREEKNSHYRDRAPIPTGWPAPGLSTSDQGRTRRLLG